MCVPLEWGEHTLGAANTIHSRLEKHRLKSSQPQEQMFFVANSLARKLGNVTELWGKRKFNLAPECLPFIPQLQELMEPLSLVRDPSPPPPASTAVFVSLVQSEHLRLYFFQ